jgi:hypothetical protein
MSISYGAFFDCPKFGLDFNLLADTVNLVVGEEIRMQGDVSVSHLKSVRLPQRQPHTYRILRVTVHV